MSDFVDNPRQAPRATIGCDARVALRDGRFFAGATVDCGPHGCQLTAPEPLRRDERIFVEMKGEGLGRAFWFAGRIAWAAEGPPFRLGVEFDAGSSDDAREFFERLTAAHPDAIDISRVPRRVALDALVAPSRETSDEVIHPVEVEVMRAVGTGLHVAALRERLGDRWEPCLNALFALLARRVLVVRADPPP